MTLVIPGVEVKVVKEVVSPQLSPSGVLGLVGFTENIPGALIPVSSWSRFIEVFGAASAYSLPEAAAALANGVSELVVAPMAADAGTKAKVDVAGLKADGTDDTQASLSISARAPGPWANDLTVTIVTRTNLDGTKVFDVAVKQGDKVLETIRNLTMSPADIGRFGSASQRLTATLGKAVWPKDGVYKLAGAKDATGDAYVSALAALENDADVDMVLVAVQSSADPKLLAKVYSATISHCDRMSAVCKGRIGFGQVPTTGTVPDWANLATNLVSDRFMLLAPNGVAGAVAGMVGGLEYFQSPTFKPLTGLTELKALVVDDQATLLSNKVVPVVTQRGRGTIVLRALTTDGDQVNVRRVADRAVRAVKMIGDLFIGKLNNEQGRTSLKQKLIEFLAQIERDGAIVPSTDGKSPAYTLNVYSSQADFAAGIVRIDLAVRPVRAIDFIYATVVVQA